MSKDQDAALLEDCKRGDRKALDSLVRRYERQVFKVAVRILGNRDEAADVTQTVFMKAFENLHKYDAKRRFFSWIYRIAINESINQLNRRKNADVLQEHLGVSSDRPDNQLENDQMSSELRWALDQLSSDQKTVIVLRHFVEHSYDEIAEVLGIEPKTVKSRLYSARQKMRDTLLSKGILEA